MAKGSEEYWREREETQRQHNIHDEKQYNAEIRKIYQRMEDEIRKEINGFYGKYAAKEGITIEEARRRVSKLDMEEYSRKAKEYVANRDLSPQANEEMRLYNLTMKVNRLEMLKATIGVDMVGGFDDLEKLMGQKLTEKALDEMERQAGILGRTVQNNEEMAHAIVNASFHNAKFSDRIWMYQDMLKGELDQLLSTGLIQGKHPTELARHLHKFFGVSRYDAERLMRTEMARVQTEAQKQSLLANGFQEYEFITVGYAACPICAALDGKHFKLKEMQPGRNAPPMHPNCRCSTAAWMDREAFDQWLDSGAAADGVSFEVFVDNVNKELNYARRGVTNDSDDDIINTNSKASSSTLLGQLTKSNIKAVPVNPLENPLTSEEIIKKIHGIDRSGSCTSLALAYIGNKLGLDVKDLRGGESAKYFSDTNVVKAIAKMAGGKTIKKENDFEAVKILLKGVTRGKEFFISSGRHSTIVRKAARGYEYLRLQDGRGVGFYKLNDSELKNTFGCSKTHTRYGIHYDASSMLFDIDNLKDNEEFKEILRYINSQGQ